jgi:hypothetical protein
MAYSHYYSDDPADGRLSEVTSTMPRCACPRNCWKPLSAIEDFDLLHGMCWECRQEGCVCHLVFITCDPSANLARTNQRFRRLVVAASASVILVPYPSGVVLPLDMVNILKYNPCDSDLRDRMTLAARLAVVADAVEKG